MKTTSFLKLSESQIIFLNSLAYASEQVLFWGIQCCVCFYNPIFLWDSYSSRGKHNLKQCRMQCTYIGTINHDVHGINSRLLLLVWISASCSWKVPASLKLNVVGFNNSLCSVSLNSVPYESWLKGEESPGSPGLLCRNCSYPRGVLLWIGCNSVFVVQTVAVTMSVMGGHIPIGVC